MNSSVQGGEDKPHEHGILRMFYSKFIPLSAPSTPYNIIVNWVCAVEGAR